MIFFDNKGNIEHFSRLSANDNLVIRVNANRYHAMIVLSKYAIFHEARVGPFDTVNDTIMAQWIKSNQMKYMKKILKRYEG